MRAEGRGVWRRLVETAVQGEMKTEIKTQDIGGQEASNTLVMTQTSCNLLATGDSE